MARVKAEAARGFVDLLFDPQTERVSISGP